MKFELNRGLTKLAAVRKFKYATWDVEASNWWDLQLIGMYDGSHYYHYRDVAAFVEHILQNQFNGYRFFAHFGGRYDLNFLFDYLREFRKDIEMVWYCSGAMVVRMTLRRNRTKIVLCDSYRLLQAKLGDLTKAFDVKHKKLDIDFETEIVYSKKLIEYNEYDCIGLYEVLERFYQETDMTSETFATHALRIFRRDFLQETLWKPRSEVLDFVRSSYHGGRVEVFKKHGKNLNGYDVNSMYPRVMLNPVPVEYLGQSRRLSDERTGGFVEATVKYSETYISMLPVRREKLYFPVGIIRGIWSIQELRLAELHGAHIEKVHRVHYFRETGLFIDFIQKLYYLKKTSGEPTRTIAKLLMNSLYGKFGQNPTKQSFYTEEDAPDGSEPILTPDGDPSGFAVFESESRAAYLLPHIASAITSFARIELAQKLNDNVFYCDTDSIFTPEIMDTGTEIGEWSHIARGEFTFFQPKLYHHTGETRTKDGFQNSDIWKAKGLTEKIHENHAPADLPVMLDANGNPTKYRKQSLQDYVDGGVNLTERHRSITEALKRNMKAKESLIIEKRMGQSRQKRAWINKQDTRPWDIEELDK